MKTTRMLTVIMVLALGVDVEVVNADFTFGTPTNLGPLINTEYDDALASLSKDGLTLYFGSDRPGGYGGYDLWVTTRATKQDPWGEPVNLGPTVNSSATEGGPNISADDLSLFLTSGRPGGLGDRDLWVTTRATVDDNWGTPVNLGPTVNSPDREFGPSVPADGLSLYFDSTRPGGYGDQDLWVTTRATTDDNWGDPINLGSMINTSARENFPGISPDGMLLFFGSNRSGGSGSWELYMARRKTTKDPWGSPMNLGPVVNSTTWETGPKVSYDGSMLYFQSARSGGFGYSDIWQTPIEPVVDLNSNGIVDADDMCIIVDHWGTDNQLCDIGPMPWGDGIVDVQDLIVLAEDLFTDYRSAAQWKLDETEGDIAYDSIGTNDAVVIGDAVWQPGGGQVSGALAFDGIDDYLSTDFVLNPMDGAFSVFTWIKGGAPGQVIISQTAGTSGAGSTWLGTDASEGKFMSGLTHATLQLKSDYVITDDHWHDIGLVYDESSKYLYVDGAEVAKDEWRPLLGNDGGLHIGAGKDLEPGSFFSGLIDDVRIYNRAIIP
jgi:hypothetical protein